MLEGSGSGSIPLTNESGRPKTRGSSGSRTLVIMYTEPFLTHTPVTGIVPRETREGWPLLTVETKVNRDSKSTVQIKRVLPRLVRWKKLVVFLASKLSDCYPLNYFMWSVAES
jgi:hypothetical protein